MGSRRSWPTLPVAAAVVSLNPIASIAADAGLDWQRSKWLYDGPAPGTGGIDPVVVRDRLM